MSYSSYRQSAPSGMTRGRGFGGRGGSRGGRGGGESSWGSSGRGTGRGGFTGPSRGRFNWYKEHSSPGFDSRNRYGSGVGDGSDRYSSRGRGDDSYRRYNRMDGPGGYSGRDHHRSPERKRMRGDGYPQASSARRSHEGSYGGGPDYNSRYSYAEDKGSYGEERGRGYRDERRSAAGFRDRSREDYPHRKAEHLESDMPPPSSGPPRHVSSPRGSFRGRISSRGSRGLSRFMLARRADSILARKRRLIDSYTARKQYLARAHAESLRRLKMQKLRRLREAAAKKESAKTEKDTTKTTEDISDEEKEANWEEGKATTKKIEKSEGEAEGGDEEEEEDDEEEEEEEVEEELEEGETPDKKEKKVKKVKKELKKEKKDEEPEEGEEVEEEEEETEGGEKADKAETEKKADAKSNGGVHVTIKQGSDDRAVSEEEGHRRTNFLKRPFIRLTCPHCYLRCITFKEYALHLYSSKHVNAMRKQALRHKQTLARMRLTQRQKQRIIEENEELKGTLSSRNNFCPICKLYYRQLKAKHQGSEAHRAMRKFLMPYCSTCRMGFKSPMMYENHVCSLDHIKRKALLDERIRARRSRSNEASGGEDEEKEVNMDKFMILDSVGTVDDTADEDSDAEGKPKEKKEGEEKKPKAEIRLGAEYIKKVEVYFCDLCRLYLPRFDNPDRELSIHCRTRTHLQRYVRYRDDRALRKEAERIHRKEMAKENAEKDTSKNEEKGQSNETEEDGKDASEKKDDNAKGGDMTGKKDNEEEGEASHDESRTADLSFENNAECRMDGENVDVDLDQDLEAGMDDKLWADVDKDLGDLLREVEPGNKSSDEDDDSRAEGGRYDRFRYSEKGNVAANPDSDVVESTTKTAAETEDEPMETDAEEKKCSDAKTEGENSAKKGGNTTPTPSTTVD